MIPSERLKGIEAFVVSADTGSFTAAAERLNLTSSAIGKGVARLEARLGSRLFERTTRRLALTDQGAAGMGLPAAARCEQTRHPVRAARGEQGAVLLEAARRERGRGRRREHEAPRAVEQPLAQDGAPGDERPRRAERLA